jgi:REP element-mobilizing transposase RayT
MEQILKKILEVKVLTMNSDKDHIHIYMSIPAKMRVSDVVRTIKSIIGWLLKKKFELYKESILGGETGYGRTDILYQR